MFNLAIDSKLRGCDVVALKVEDVAPNGYAVDRSTARQRKTGQPVRFELTEQTRQAIDDYLKETGMKAGDFLFPSRRNGGLSRPGRRSRRAGPASRAPVRDAAFASCVDASSSVAVS
jgi:integrase